MMNQRQPKGLSLFLLKLLLCSLSAFATTQEASSATSSRRLRGGRPNNSQDYDDLLSNVQNILNKHHGRDLLIGSFSQFTSNADGIRLVAQYQGLRARGLIQSCANQVLNENTNEQTMLFLLKQPWCLEQLLKDTDVLQVDFDYPVRVIADDINIQKNNRQLKDEEAVKSLPSLDELWGIPYIQADQLGMGDHPIKVCVADTGLAINHPFYEDATIQQQITGSSSDATFYGEAKDWSSDEDGHGTHVAGTILSTILSSGGSTSGFSMHITRAMDNEGGGFEYDVRQAVQQCIDQGAKIINLSLGSNYISLPQSQFYKQVVEEQGILLIAASGNDGTDAPVYPASDPSVMAVSAVGEDGNALDISNYGKNIELAVPGSMIYSTGIDKNEEDNGDLQYSWQYRSGTSMAVPHVSAAAAILWSHFGDECTNHQIRFALILTAKQKGDDDSKWNEHTGYGTVQVKDAYDFIQAKGGCSSWELPTIGLFDGAE